MYTNVRAVRDVVAFRWRGLLTLLFFFVSAYIFYQFQGGFVSGFLFYSVLLLSIIEIILFVGTMGSVHARRRMSHRVLTAGQHVLVEVEVRFKSFLPFVWVSLEDRLPTRLETYTEGNRLWQMGSFRRTYTLRYRIKRVPRGEHTFGKVTIYVGDLFGFFTRTHKVHVPASVLVYPSYQELRYFRSINDKNAGLSYSLNRNAEDVTSVMGVRNYVSGDRLSRIHWRASARTGQLKTKEFEYNVTNDFMFFIDCERKSYQSQPQLFERAVTLAATLIRYALNNHFTAGLSLFHKEEIIVPLARHQEQLVRLYTQLARIEADSTFAFAKHLLRQVAYLPFGTTAMVITAHIDEDLVHALSVLRMKKVSVELFYVTNDMQQGRNVLNRLVQDGVSVHIVATDDIAESLKGVGSSGQVS